MTEWNKIFPDLILTEKANQEFKKKGTPLPLEFNPIPYNKPGILFYHSPEFLEDNYANLTYADIAGATVWLGRIQALKDFFENEFRPYYDDLYHEGHWKEYFYNDTEREKTFLKVDYFALLNCNGAMGYSVSGLYLDFDKLKETLELSPKEALRIIDNNMFLGDMATFYSASVWNKENPERREALKKKYLKVLDIIVKNPKVHFTTKYKVQERLTDSADKNKKFVYEDMLTEHLSTINKVTSSPKKVSAITPV